MAVAARGPGHSSNERAVGFALAPRLNAAGRLYRADAALELILTEDPSRARADRRGARPRQPRAQARRDAHPLRGRSADRGAGRARARTCSPARAGIPGVIGIVASRLAERHRRPVVLIALDGRCRDGIGAQHRGLRPARWPDGVRRAPARLRRSSRRRRPGDRARACGGVRGGARRRTPSACSSPQDRAGASEWTPWWAAISSGWSSRRSCSGWRRSGGQPGRLAAGAGARVSRRASDGGRQARALHGGVTRRPRARRSRSARAAACRSRRVRRPKRRSRWRSTSGAASASRGWCSATHGRRAAI